MPAIVLGILLITKTVLLFLSLSYKCETEARQTQMKEVIQNMNSGLSELRLFFPRLLVLLSTVALGSLVT